MSTAVSAAAHESKLLMNEENRKENIMDKKAQAITEDLNTLAEDAQDLINATAEVTGDKVANARKRLAAALENSKEIYGRVREKAIEGAKATDRAVHEHPYQALGVALGLGVLIGVLIGRRGRND